MKGKLLNLVFPFGISPRINAKGEVRWTGRVVDIKYYLGVRFSQMPDEDERRVANHIYE
jgi:hypothetical protein